MAQTVFFPGLGLSFLVNNVAFKIFGIEIYWYGVIIGSGFFLAVLLCCRWAKQYGITADELIDFLIFAVPAAVIGLRVYYVLFNLDYFRDGQGKLDFGAIINLRDGGLAIYGGIIAAIITLYVFCRIKKISFLSFADLGVHGLLIGQCIGRWGNFFNVEAYGALTTLPWRMCSSSIASEMYAQSLATADQAQAIVNGTLGVHPTFFYESLWNFVGIFLIYFIGKKFRKFDGQVFLSYFIWYGAGRFWIEGLRTDSLYFFGLKLFGAPIRVSQMLSALMVVISLGVLIYLFVRKRTHGTGALFVSRVSSQKVQQQAEEIVSKAWQQAQSPTQEISQIAQETDDTLPPDGKEETE